jgi:hypothetical protein
MFRVFSAERLARERHQRPTSGMLWSPPPPISTCPCEGTYPLRDLPLADYTFIGLGFRRILLVELWSLS